MDKDVKAMLELKNINAGYDKLGVLWDVNISINENEFVALIGQNGAGKTTILKTITGIVKPTSGNIVYKGNNIEGMMPNNAPKHGISFVTDGGNLFSGMSVMDNIRLGAYLEKDKKKIKARIEDVFELFPRLAERKSQYAETLSGGERKMLAIARGLMSDPKLMLVDEPSLGLAPKLVMDVFQTLQKLTKRGVTILLVEQNVNTTLKMTDRAYVLNLGRIVKSGTSADLLNDPQIRKEYLGID